MMKDEIIDGVLFLKHHLCEVTGGAIGLCLSAQHTGTIEPPHVLSVIGFAVLGSAAGWLVKALLDRALDPVIEKYFPKKK